MLEVSENSIKLQETAGQPKDPWLATRAPRSTWAELKNNPAGKANTNITNMAATEGTADQETSY